MIQENTALNKPARQKGWPIVSMAPGIFASFGTLITLLAYFQLWGGSTKAAFVLGVFFSEITLVITAFGLLAYLRTHNKNSRAKNIARLNWCIVAYSVTVAICLFLY